MKALWRSWKSSATERQRLIATCILFHVISEQLAPSATYLLYFLTIIFFLFHFSEFHQTLQMLCVHSLIIQHLHLSRNLPFGHSPQCCWITTTVSAASHLGSPCLGWWFSLWKLMKLSLCIILQSWGWLLRKCKHLVLLSAEFMLKELCISAALWCKWWVGARKAD